MDRGGERLSARRPLDESIVVASGRSVRFLALAVAASVAMGFDFSLVPVSAGLDPSYVYALNFAAAHHLQWGRDFISTYGPYRYLVQTMDLNLSTLLWGRIAFGLLSAVGLGIAVAAYLESVPDLSPVARLASMVAITYTFSIQDPEYRLLILFLVVFLRSLRMDDVAGRKRLCPRRRPGGLLPPRQILARLHVPGDSPRWLRAGATANGGGGSPRRDDPRRRRKLPGRLDPRRKGSSRCRVLHLHGLGDESGLLVGHELVH